jgi:hypothetical protein
VQKYENVKINTELAKIFKYNIIINEFDKFYDTKSNFEENNKNTNIFINNESKKFKFISVFKEVELFNTLELIKKNHTTITYSNIDNKYMCKIVLLTHTLILLNSMHNYINQNNKSDILYKEFKEKLNESLHLFRREKKSAIGRYDTFTQLKFKLGDKVKYIDNNDNNVYIIKKITTTNRCNLIDICLENNKNELKCIKQDLLKIHISSECENLPDL